MDEPAEAYVPGAYLTSLASPCLAASGLAAEAPNTDPLKGAGFYPSLLNKFPVADAGAAVAGLAASVLPNETFG